MRRILITTITALVLLALTRNNPVQALSISPLIFSYELDAGDVVSGTIVLQNDLSQTRTYTPVIKNFVASDDESGTPRFVGDEVTDHSLAAWLTFSSTSITMSQSEERKISFSVKAPDTVAPGSYYGAIIFEGVATAPNNSQINEQIGALLLLTIPGDVPQAASILDFGIDKHLSSALPVTFSARVENTGELTTQPWGAIYITNVFGAVRETLPFNPRGGHILPNSTRKFETVWQLNEVAEETLEIVKEWRNFAFGYYRATLVMNYGELGEVENATVGFWVIPWQLLTAVLAGLGLLTLLSRLIKNRNK